MGNGNETNIAGIRPEGRHWGDYWRHHHVEKPRQPELFDLRSPGQLVAVYLVYFLPLFIVGVCGWATLHWPVTNASGVLHLPPIRVLVFTCTQLGSRINASTCQCNAFQDAFCQAALSIRLGVHSQG